MSRYEMRFTGSGGQGVILASIVFAEAAVLAGMNTVQSQAYGPEARGGLCKAETIISGEAIWYSKVQVPNFLLALTQSSLDVFVPQTAEDAIILADDSLVLPRGLGERKVYTLPILRAAVERVGKAMTANIIAVGAINGILRLFEDEVLAEAVKRHTPAGTEKLNGKALEVGKELAAALSL